MVGDRFSLIVPGEAIAFGAKDCETASACICSLRVAIARGPISNPGATNPSPSRLPHPIDPCLFLPIEKQL